MTTSTLCAYCGHDDTYLDKHKCCIGCGARLRVTHESEKFTLDRGDTFYYNGLLVVPIRNPAAQTYEYQFWAGDRLLEKITFSQDIYRALWRSQPGVDIMPLVWQLFEVAHGERDHGLILDNSQIETAMIYFARRLPPSDQVTWESLVEEYKRNPSDVIEFKHSKLL